MSSNIPTWTDIKDSGPVHFSDFEDLDPRGIPRLRTQYLAWLSKRAGKQAYNFDHAMLASERARWDHKHLFGVTTDMLDYVTALKPDSHPKGNLADNELTGSGAVVFSTPIGVAPPANAVGLDATILINVGVHAAAWTPGTDPGTVLVSWYALTGDDDGLMLLGVTFHDRGRHDNASSGNSSGAADLVRYSQYLRTILIMRDQAKIVQPRSVRPPRPSKTQRRRLGKQLGKSTDSLLGETVQVLTVHTMHQAQIAARTAAAQREGRKLAYRIEVDPYIRRTHFGPGKSQCEQRWVNGYVRGPEGAPLLVRDKVELIDR